MLLLASKKFQWKRSESPILFGFSVVFFCEPFPCSCQWRYKGSESPYISVSSQFLPRWEWLVGLKHYLSTNWHQMRPDEILVWDLVWNMICYNVHTLPLVIPLNKIHNLSLCGGTWHSNKVNRLTQFAEISIKKKKNQSE